MFTYTAFLGTFADIIVCKAGHNHNKQINCLNITISMKESALFMKNDDFGVQKNDFRDVTFFTLKKKLDSCTKLKKVSISFKIHLK